MKTIQDKENSNKYTIVIEDNDIIEIETLNGNKQIIEIKCLGHSLHIEEKRKKCNSGDTNER